MRRTGAGDAARAPADAKPAAAKTEDERARDYAAARARIMGDAKPPPAAKKAGSWASQALAASREAAYFLTTFDAAVAAVAKLGGETLAAADAGDDDDDDDDDDGPWVDGDDDFGALAEAAEARDGGDDAAMRDLGAWLGSHTALEDTVDLLRDEGWMA